MPNFSQFLDLGKINSCATHLPNSQYKSLMRGETHRKLYDTYCCADRKAHAQTCCCSSLLLSSLSKRLPTTGRHTVKLLNAGTGQLASNCTSRFNEELLALLE
jgi:hypothetical protein